MTADGRATWEEAVSWLVGQPDRQDLVRDCYFDRPLAGAVRRYRASEEWQALRALLPAPPGLAVDVGAGNGIASYALAADGWTVVALEPDPSGLVGARAIDGLARAESLPIAVVRAIGEGIPLRAASADVVFGRQVLHHARDLGALCREVARVLKPGGRFLATREHVLSSPDDLDAFLAQHPLHHLYGGEHAYLREDYRRAIGQAGLRLERDLRPFDSAANFAPYSRARLRDELVRRAGRVPFARGLAGAVLRREPFFEATLRLLSAVDRRPGRMHTFVARKPGSP